MLNVLRLVPLIPKIYYPTLQHWAQYREELDKTGKKLSDHGIMPHRNCFHGPVEKGFGFLKSWKAMSKEILDARKMQVFYGLLKKEAFS